MLTLQKVRSVSRRRQARAEGIVEEERKVVESAGARVHSSEAGDVARRVTLAG